MGSLMLDTHTHTTVSDGYLTPLEAVRLARRRGCGALAVTDHDTIEGGLRAYKASARLGLGVIVVPGVEVRTAWGDVLALCRSPPRQEPPVGGDPSALRDWADAEGCILVAAHPYATWRHGMSGRRLVEGARLGLWDAVEAWNQRSPPPLNALAALAAARLGLPPTSGSDAHVPRELCSSRMRLPGPEPESPEDIVEAIVRGRAEPVPGLPGPLALAEAAAWGLMRRLGIERPPGLIG
jgi:predicted metal-dependent phosphoesterase TrpH